MERTAVVFSVVGNRLDQPGQRWRPTLSLIGQPDVLPVARVELITQHATGALALDLERSIARHGVEARVHHVPVADPWSFEDVYQAFYDFFRAYAWDEEHHDYYVHLTTGTHVMQIVLHQLVADHYAPARLVQTRPDRTRPLGGAIAIVDLDLASYPALARKKNTERLAGQSLLKQGIATDSAGYNALIERIERVAGGPWAPVLLAGETGVGKSALARRIHALRRQTRKLKGSFVEVNCATLRGTLRESALFGHKRGAFTGADRDRRGYLASADGGMLFLDEVGELGIDEQAILLTAIEDGSFFPLGADEPVSSRFELITGTNRDLAAMARAGTFRDDLLARIATWTFVLPPLRERREDIEANVRYELERFAERHAVRVRFAREALARYLAFARSSEARWPHNFRDLGQSIARLASLAHEGLIGTADVAAEIDGLRAAWAVRSDEPRVVAAPDRSLDYVDRVVKRAVLDVLARSVSLAAAGRVLFDRSRTQRASRNDSDRVRKLCARLGIDPRAQLRER